ncbi:3-phosphoshikimate 1-carboxyvinyltransferase [Psychroflexus sp. YR1-1]|uniref:3-phosphoshikimate 1-carboxyvinyltransferase n=1 Tax=Psychroflexus aurantiacus TaxID=2709310 RepID=A0A6B3R1C1_9FLAO|nr:3-phosphoshikimate 1-carboxyvinyltransferase [Psychroflexus aurantiacus]NEV93240.1 3-phosphoshikimate 1-carboxyvinyltransferase [Psychroflexus aurantiacus]
MKLSFSAPTTEQFQFEITGSKSISNRYLILNALFPNLELKGLSNSDDTRVLQKALAKPLQESKEIDIHHAGTAMRFLTAYVSAIPGAEVILTGSERMQERPIGILVEALRDLGASIAYVKNEGFPPLKITGKSLQKESISIPADVSSQYISALMLIAPSFNNGLTIRLESKVTSKPYLKMTAQALASVGVDVHFEDTSITVHPKTEIQPTQISVESDWSSVSYFYSCLALMQAGSMEISTFYRDSLQGDSKVAEFYALLGIKTKFNRESIQLSKVDDFKLPQKIELDLNDTPDLAQTIAVSCLGLGIGCYLTGLHTLKVKETDRLVALKTEIKKFGAEVTITDESLHLNPSSGLNSDVRIKTYQDHRMAMAFAPLAIKTDLEILNPEVVSKSFPDFWENMKVLGIQ